MTQWQDLSEEDKVKVIAGTVMAASFSVLIFIFSQMLPRDRLPFGASPFSGMRMVLLAMYVVVFVPSVLLGIGTVAYLKRRFSEMLNVLIVLLMVSIYFLFVSLFLTLFDIFLSGLPIEEAIILIALSLFAPAIIITRIMIAKKNSKYLKWAFK